MVTPAFVADGLVAARMVPADFLFRISSSIDESGECRILEMPILHDRNYGHGGCGSAQEQQEPQEPVLEYLFDPIPEAPERDDESISSDLLVFRSPFCSAKVEELRAQVDQILEQHATKK